VAATDKKAMPAIKDITGRGHFPSRIGELAAGGDMQDGSGLLAELARP
jgi:hypothetical protein